MRKLIYIPILLILLSVNVSVCESYLDDEIKLNGVLLNLPTIETLYQIETLEKDYTHEFVTYEDLGVTENEFWYLVKISHTESNTESAIGQELVVLTIMNRVEHSNFPNDVIGVVNAPSQFCGRWVKTWGNYTQENVDNVINALSRIKNGELEDWEKEVLFFHNQEVDSNSYAGKYGLTILKVIGGHTFLGYATK